MCSYDFNASDPYKYTANEIAIGLPIPRVVAEVMRMRLTLAEIQRATTLAATYTPEEAVAVGILDDVVPLDGLLDHANDIAAQFVLLDPRAHQGT